MFRLIKHDPLLETVLAAKLAKDSYFDTKVIEVGIWQYTAEMIAFYGFIDEQTRSTGKN